MNRDDRIAEGRRRAERVATRFGWEVEGYGFPGAGAKFRAPAGHSFNLCGEAMSAVLAWLDENGGSDSDQDPG